MATALSDSSNASTLNATVLKKRKVSRTSTTGDDITVEDHLNMEFEKLERKVMDHANEKIRLLQAEFNKLKDIMLSSVGMSDQQNAHKITLTATEGPYKGKSWSHVLRLQKVKKTRGRKAKEDRSKTVRVCIGRSKQAKYIKNGVSLAKDDCVSTTHATISLIRGKGLFLEDRGSTNGTFLDNVELEAMVPVPLLDGQKIYFGSQTCMSVDIRMIS